MQRRQGRFHAIDYIWPLHASLRKRRNNRSFSSSLCDIQKDSDWQEKGSPKFHFIAVNGYHYFNRKTAPVSYHIFYHA